MSRSPWPGNQSRLTLLVGLAAEYGTALTLKAMAETDSSAAAESRSESDRILARLGVVSTPLVPLP
jgi:hypothetical protein